MSLSLVVTSDTELYVSPSSVLISLTLAASSLLATLAASLSELSEGFCAQSGILFHYPLFLIGDEGINVFMFVKVGRCFLDYLFERPTLKAKR